jgi:hypothetical protein
MPKNASPRAGGTEKICAWQRKMVEVRAPLLFLIDGRLPDDTATFGGEPFPRRQLGLAGCCKLKSTAALNTSLVALRSH